MWVDSTIFVQDTESDTFVYKTWPEKFSDMLSEIGVESVAQEIATVDLESGDYYSRYFSQTPRMVTNKGCVEVKNSNIDVIQIIQKG